MAAKDTEKAIVQFQEALANAIKLIKTEDFPSILDENARAEAMNHIMKDAFSFSSKKIKPWKY